MQLVSYKDNEWNFPGGGREGRETPLQNILRELSEELGVAPEDFEPLGQAQNPIIYDFPQSMIDAAGPRALKYKGQQKDQIFLRFVGEKTAIRPDPREIARYFWCPSENLDRYLLFPNQLKAAKKALRDFAQGPKRPA